MILTTGVIGLYRLDCRQTETWVANSKSFVNPAKIRISHPNHNAFIVDLGIKTLAKLSTGEDAPAIQAYRQNRRKLKIA